MHNKKFIAFLSLTIIFSYLAANFVVAAIKSYTPVVKYDEPISIVVASKDISPYATIKPDQVRLKEVPASLAPSDHFRDPSELVGSVSRGLILAGDFVRRGHLTETGSAGNEVTAELSALGDPNLRAVFVPLPEGFQARKGDRVNIIYIEKGREEAKARTLFQNVLVLKVEKQDAFLVMNQRDAEVLAEKMFSGQIMYTLSPVAASRVGAGG